MKKIVHLKSSEIYNNMIRDYPSCNQKENTWDFYCEDNPFQVTCGNCKRTKEYKKAIDEWQPVAKEKTCKYPNLRSAIMARKDMKIRVTPEQSEDVQKIAFECRVDWRGYCDKIIKHKEAKFLYIHGKSVQYSILKGDHDEIFFKRQEYPEFSLEHDCFVDEINPIIPVVNSVGERFKFPQNETTKHPENKFGEYLKVFNLIANEVQRAEKLHHEFPADLIHQSAVLNEESGEVTKAALDHHYEQKPIADVYTEAIHTAAVAVRMLLNRRDK